MSRDATDFADDFNPYAAPASGRPRPRQVVEAAFPPPLQSVFWVDHDLSDQDLRRYPDFDVFYDPMPLFGFIPQWVTVEGILFTFCFIGVWLRFESLPTALVCGVLGVGAFLVGTSRMMAANRQAARHAGLCEGRRVTISASGLRVRIAGRPEAQTYQLGAASYEWLDFRRVEFLGGYLILWQNGRARLVIPERAFATPDEADRFAYAVAGWTAAAR